MRLQNKERIAYLAALTLLLSYAEMLLPRIVPFFRLGLGNIAILLSLDLDPLSFFILTVIKSVANSLISGTLFSPFMLISLAQSVISGLVMWGLFFCAKKYVSVYGVSILGATVSAIVQIILSALYLGNGTYNLLGPMVIFGICSGILTAFLSQKLCISSATPKLTINTSPTSSKENFISIFLIIVSVALIFTLNDLVFLIITLLTTFIFQLICKRRILLLPHISLWLFVIISGIFIPSGKILFSLGTFNITQGAIILALNKALKLSATMTLSQCAVSIDLHGNGIVSMTLGYFSGINNEFRKYSGNIFQKIKASLSAQNLNFSESNQNKTNKHPMIIFLVLFLILVALNIAER